MSRIYSGNPADSDTVRSHWWPVEQPPEPYEVAFLKFEDGTVRRGTWTGKVWRGYDERVRRSRELAPVAWQPYFDVRWTTIAHPPAPGHPPRTESESKA